jgi:hypothetical protein
MDEEEKVYFSRTRLRECKNWIAGKSWWLGYLLHSSIKQGRKCGALDKPGWKMLKMGKHFIAP